MNEDIEHEHNHQKLWHGDYSFTAKLPDVIFQQLLKDDKSNYDDTFKKYPEEIKAVDQGIKLFIAQLQVVYKNADKWKDNIPLKASLLMASSTLNYLLLERYGMLMGYYPETRDLQRACYERMTRCLAFNADNDLAKKYLSGVKISQVDIDEVLSQHLSKAKGDEKKTYEDLRANYKHKSNILHPNLDSLKERINIDTKTLLDNNAIIPFTIGGFMSDDNFIAVNLALAEDVFFALRIFRLIVIDQSGEADKIILELGKYRNRQLTKLKGIVG